jgi:hypothetical protein
VSPRLAIVLSTLCLAVWACSGGGGGAGTMGVGGASSAAGMSGAAGASGAAGVNAMDGGPDAAVDGPSGAPPDAPSDASYDTPSDASSDASSSARAEKACRDAVIAQCERFAACFGGLLDSYGCTAQADRCPSYYFNPRTLRTVENVEACVPLLRAATCTDFAMGLASQCLLGGIGAAGAPCSGASECASRTCSTAAPNCGTCGVPIAAGAPCGGGGSCVSGTVCHPTMRVCVAAPITIAHAKAGAPCDTGAAPPVGCEGDLDCRVGAGGGTAGTCTARPGQGEACLSVLSAQCAPGLDCGISTTTGARQTICGNPRPCGATTCAPTSFCFESPQVQLHCQPYLTAGQECPTDAGDGQQECAPGTACLPRPSDAGLAHGVCIALAERGQLCDASAPCRNPFVCRAGLCAPFDPATCFASVDAGPGQ